MAAQFFFHDRSQDKSVGDIVSSINQNTQFETEQANRADEWRRKQALHKAFSGNIDAQGNLNEKNFYIQASQDGLDPAQIGQAIDYHNKQIDQMSKIANEQPAQRMQGFDPTSAGRNEAGFGAPDEGSIIPGMQKVASPSLAGAGAPLAPSTLDVDNLRDPSEVGGAQTAPPEQPAPTTTALDRLKRMSKAQVKEVQRELGFDKKEQDGKVGPLTAKRLRAALTIGSVMEGSNLGDLVGGTSDEGIKDYADTEGGQVTINTPFQSKGEEAKMAPDNIGPDVFAPAPEDNRTFTQKFEDSYNPANTLGVGGAGAFGGADDPMFKWEPTDDNSNAFRVFKTALASKLNSEGYADANQKLKTIYLNTYKSNMPTAPNEGLLSLGKEGIAKYRGEQKAYQAGIQKAQGLAQAAVNAERESLAKFAKEYGVDTQTNEKFEADMGGRRKGGTEEIIRLRPVSEAEKTRGEMVANSYLDLKASKELGGFEGDYAGAMAKAKSDGNVNADIVTGHLISMGSFPTEKSAYIKQMLSTTPMSAWDVALKKIYAELGGKFYRDDAKRSKWYAGAEKNMIDAMKLSGYGVAEPKKGNAGDKLKAKTSAKATYTKTKSGHKVETF